VRFQGRSVKNWSPIALGSISSTSSDVSCVGLTFYHILFSLERNAGTLGTLGTSKKVVLRSTDRGPGTPLELPLERPSGTPTVNPPTVRCAASEVA
jgi:hypothetical protein